MNKQKIALIIVIILEVLTLTALITFITLSFYEPSMEDMLVDEINCSGMNLSDTAYCLNDYVNDIFIYNLTDDSRHLSLNELKERGGDCRDWVEFYSENLNKYGFDTKKERIFVKKIERDNETISVFHKFLIAYSSTAYCIVDMENTFCFKYEVGNA